MNISQAKQIPLTKIIDALGYSGKFSHEDRSGDLWYYSFWRDEKEPSLQVSADLKAWNDWGTDGKGNILSLVTYDEFRRNCEKDATADISFALKRISELVGEYQPSRDYQTGDLFTHSKALGSRRSDQSDLEIVRVQELQNEALISYISGIKQYEYKEQKLYERGIPVEIAKTYVQEMYYRQGGNNYFALCFPNSSRGYELRNKYHQRAVAPKDITLIDGTVIGLKNFADKKKNEGGIEAITVFEGFIDFLSALTHHKKPISTPVIVLNSTKLTDKAVEAVREAEASKVYLYLDRDEAGKKATEDFKHQLQGIAVVDNSAVYAGFKDFNKFLVMNKIKAKSR